ncbi:MAG TPA: DUF4185 domain-containing protein [Bryobacteraceae bacterium]|jgi:hypothetical protein
MGVVVLSAPAVQIDADFFPYAQGWLGGDAAYSIPLDQYSTVWLFGDTFTGTRRTPATMIHNSIAIRKCQGSDCRVSYWWSGMRARHASSFFKTHETDYFWPLDGFVYRRRLYVFLEQMHTTGGGGAFGFDYSGIWLATVSNPFSSPDRWRISYQSISPGNVAVPGIATVIESNRLNAGYLSVFTLFRRPNSEPFCGLLRLSLNDLPSAGQSPNWQYLAVGSRWLPWKRSTSPADALKLLGGNITEMSVAFHPDNAQWVAIYPLPGFLTNAASYSTAKEIRGPWTPPQRLFTYPEMQKGDSRYTQRVFCYAAKEHVELERTGEIAFSYACNSTKESEILNDMRLYRPILVRMAFSSH